MQAKANVALLGPPGVGKTHIAVALAVAACRAGFTVYFTTLDDLVRQLKAADAIGWLARELRTCCGPHVLVIDEVGLRPLERSEANLVFEVISKRYEKGSTLLTSNKGFGKPHMSPRTCVRHRRKWTGSAANHDALRTCRRGPSIACLRSPRTSCSLPRQRPYGRDSSGGRCSPALRG
ncbi:ATP-binding protein [Paractinoplanes hotanensis]|uniref:ATP-binding protein n=1 Tax=Paractinoplanes hotanensis TaxID=2906497 RepID=A0ABT0XSV4_9ACTN|nr:ATP-binding protein [Actinoplanes hotanensis]MCM4076853.1 ATP-binding protein [Actinoplanes hotanensis]